MAHGDHSCVAHSEARSSGLKKGEMKGHHGLAPELMQCLLSWALVR